MKIRMEAGSYGNEVAVEHQTERSLQLSEDRDFVNAVFNKAIIQAITQLESNEKINPKPKDEPCCNSFDKMAGCSDNRKWLESMVFCPFCNTQITKERKDKYL